MRPKKAEILGLLVVLAALLVLPPPTLFADTPANDVSFAEKLLERGRQFGNKDYLDFAKEVALPIYNRSSNPRDVRIRAAKVMRGLSETLNVMTGEQRYADERDRWEQILINIGDETIIFERLFRKLLDANDLVANARDLEASEDESNKKKAVDLRKKAVEEIKKVQEEFEGIIKTLRAEADRLVPPDKLDDPTFIPSREGIEAMFQRNFAEFLYARSYLDLSRAHIENKDKQEALDKAEELLNLYVEGVEEEERFAPLKQGIVQKGARDGQFPVLDGNVKVTLGEVYMEMARIAEGEDKAEKLSDAIAYFDEASWFCTNEVMNDKVEKKILDINMQGYFRKAQAYNMMDEPGNAIKTVEEMLARKHKVCGKCNLWTTDLKQEWCVGFEVHRGQRRDCGQDLRTVEPVLTFSPVVVAESINGKQALYELAEAYTETGEFVKGVEIAYKMYEAELIKRDPSDPPSPIEVESAKKMAEISLKTNAVFPAKISFGIAKGFLYRQDKRRAAIAFKDSVSAAGKADADIAAEALMELGKSYYFQEVWLLAYSAFITLAREYPESSGAASAARYAEKCLDNLEKGHSDDKENKKPEKLNTKYMTELKKEATGIFAKLGQGIDAQKRLFADALDLRSAAVDLLENGQKEEKKARNLEGDEKKNAENKAMKLFNDARDKFLAAAKSFEEIVMVVVEKDDQGLEKRTDVTFYPVARQWGADCYMQAAQTYSPGVEELVKKRIELLGKAIAAFEDAIKKADEQGKLSDRKEELNRIEAIARAKLYLGQAHLDIAWPVADRKAHREAAVKALSYFDGALTDSEKITNYSAQARLQQIFANFPLEQYEAAETACRKLEDGMKRGARGFANYARFAAWWLGDHYNSLGEELEATGEEEKAKPFFVKAAIYLDKWKDISEQVGQSLSDGQKLWVADVQRGAGRHQEAIQTYESFFKGKELKDCKTEQDKTNYLSAKLGYANCLVALERFEDAAKVFDWFKNTEWKDKLLVVEGRGNAYYRLYIKQKAEGKADPEVLQKALIAYFDLYRKTPETHYVDGKPDPSKLKMAQKHWQYTYRLMVIYFYQQRFIEIRTFLADFFEQGEGKNGAFDSPELKDVVSGRLVEKFRDIYEKAGKKVPKKQ
ncbi:MAG: tetratricopeptide repeat protein [Planctomycetota bacterium]